jgi:murein DD-endopeptidase MepM/ murein hydrolase activator NlpD
MLKYIFIVPFIATFLFSSAKAEIVISETNTPSVFPIDKKIPYRISFKFGQRNRIYKYKHSGIDYATRKGAPIFACASGVVKKCVKSRMGYGNYLLIDHGNGYESLYAHNSVNLVKKGDKIEAGQKIAKVGSSGRSTGSHLHFEIRKDGKAIDPNQFYD